MRSYRLNLLLVLSLFFILTITPCDANTVSVRVEYGDSPSFDLQFADSPRLAELISGIRFNTPPYWPAARFYRLSSTVPETMRTKVLESLNALENQWQQKGKTQLAQSAATLAKTIREWPLAERILVPLNYDLIRIYPEHNPRVDHGHYLLSMKDRPNTVEVLGLISTSPSVALHHGGVSVREYVRTTSQLKGACPDWVHIISPAGVIEKAPIASWNHHHREVRPGSQLLVLFSPAKLPREFKNINLEIARLAQHRIAP